jgi:hypothetical protein
MPETSNTSAPTTRQPKQLRATTSKNRATRPVAWRSASAGDWLGRRRQAVRGSRRAPRVPEAQRYRVPDAPAAAIHASSPARLPRVAYPTPRDSARLTATPVSERAIDGSAAHARQGRGARAQVEPAASRRMEQSAGTLADGHLAAGMDEDRSSSPRPSSRSLSARASVSVDDPECSKEFWTTLIGFRVTTPDRSAGWRSRRRIGRSPWC